MLTISHLYFPKTLNVSSKEDPVKTIILLILLLLSREIQEAEETKPIQKFTGDMNDRKGGRALGYNLYAPDFGALLPSLEDTPKVL